MKEIEYFWKEILVERKLQHSVMGAKENYMFV